MKHFSLFLLLAVITGFGVALFLSQRENRRLSAQIVELTATVDSYQNLVESRNENLAHSRLGTVVLYRMALSGDHNDLFDFLDTVPVGSLRCKVMDLPEYPTIKLLWYSQNRESADGTWVPLDQAKAVSFVVNSDTFDVVDHVMIKGFTGVSKGMNRPYRIECKLPDGTPVKYWIQTTGFERRQ